MRRGVCSYKVALANSRTRRAIRIQAVARQFLAKRHVAKIHRQHLEAVKLTKVGGGPEADWLRGRAC